MKHIVMRSFCFLIFNLLSLPPGVQAAEVKIAFVRIAEAVKMYHKTVTASAENESLLKKKQDEMMPQLDAQKKLGGQLQELEAQMKGLHTSARADAEADFNKKKASFQEMTSRLVQEQNKFRQEVTTRMSQQSRALMEEVYEVVQTVAAQEGFGLVFDKADGVTSPLFPVLIVAAPGAATDLTDKVIRELNKTAPRQAEAQNLTTH